MSPARTARAAAPPRPIVFLLATLFILAGLVKVRDLIVHLRSPFDPPSLGQPGAALLLGFAPWLAVLLDGGLGSVAAYGLLTRASLARQLGLLLLCLVILGPFWFLLAYFTAEPFGSVVLDLRQHLAPQLPLQVFVLAVCAALFVVLLLTDPVWRSEDAGAAEGDRSPRAEAPDDRPHRHRPSGRRGYGRVTPLWI